MADSPDVERKSIPDRAFELGVRIIHLCRYMDRTPGTCRVLSSQLLRCGTSIGANVEEGQAAQSRKDFASKYFVALKEARETHFRLRLLVASKVVSPTRLGDLLEESRQIRDILAKSVVTARRNMRKEKK